MFVVTTVPAATAAATGGGEAEGAGAAMAREGCLESEMCSAPLPPEPPPDPPPNVAVEPPEGKPPEEPDTAESDIPQTRNQRYG